MNDKEINIGEQIRIGRLKKKLKQHHLVDMLGLSQQTISRYENNHTNPKRETWIKICKICDIPPANYFTEKDLKSENTLVKEENSQKYLPFEPIADDPDLIDYIKQIKKEKQFLTEIGFGNLLNYLSKISEENKKNISQHLKYYFDLVLNQKKPAKKRN
jgi:transcriptional regulator with XRE-family HTH domain